MVSCHENFSRLFVVQDECKFAIQLLDGLLNAIGLVEVKNHLAVVLGCNGPVGMGRLELVVVVNLSIAYKSKVVIGVEGFIRFTAQALNHAPVETENAGTQVFKNGGVWAAVVQDTKD